MSSITYHDALYRFRVGRDTGTTSLEDNLLQHRTAMREEVFFEIFLYLQKAFNNLDWNMYL